jgi:hypothetical protein
MLLVKVFTMCFSDGVEGFDDDALRAFMADNEVVSLKERFFFKDSMPYWSVMVVYRSGLGLTSQMEKEQGKEVSKKDEYRSVLTKESMPLFNLLRQWRNTRARKDGYPPYIMFTNLQLAEIASLFPETLSQLSSVEGVGRAKLEKYGPEILKIVKTLKGQQESEKPASQPQETTQQTEKPAELSRKETAKDIKTPPEPHEQGILWERQKEEKA